METITYEYGGGLYVNLTNRCDCACVFCLRHNGHKGSIYADDLWLDHEPTREEALADLLSRDLAGYPEIVFCGFGEPTFRLLSISLNGSTAEEYVAVTRPRDGVRAWEAMLDFTREAAKYVPEVVMTIVDKDKSPEEIAACRALCEGLGARFRVRSYIED